MEIIMIAMIMTITVTMIIKALESVQTLLRYISFNEPQLFSFEFRFNYPFAR